MVPPEESLEVDRNHQSRSAFRPWSIGQHYQSLVNGHVNEEQRKAAFESEERHVHSGVGIN